MSYADSLLASGERVVRRGTSTGSCSSGARSWAIARAAHRRRRCCSSAPDRHRQARSANAPGRARLDHARSCVVGGTRSFAWVAAPLRNEEYVITNRRVIHAEGVINKRATDSRSRRSTTPCYAVALRADVRVRRPRGPDRVRGAASSGSGCSRDANEFKKAMLEAKHDLELELARPDDAATPVDESQRGIGRCADRRRSRPHRPHRAAPLEPQPAAMTADDVTRPVAGSPTCATGARSRPRSTRRRRRELLARL